MPRNSRLQANPLYIDLDDAPAGDPALDELRARRRDAEAWLDRRPGRARDPQLDRRARHEVVGDPGVDPRLVGASRWTSRTSTCASPRSWTIARSTACATER
jgi:hypothetical protein